MVNRSRALIGLLLIVGGVIFLLDAADVVPARNILSDWWPLILVGLGLFAMFGRPHSWTGGGILVAIGGILLLATLDIIDVTLWQLIIPLILIGAGLSLVIRGLGGRGVSDRSARVSLVGVLSEQQIRSEATGFRHASLTSVLGDAEIDLRNASIDPKGAEVDAFCLLGEARILVPRGWRIHVDGVPILAEFKDETEHPPELPYDAPQLNITGVSILGDVKVRHA
jgi:predicted membrane protein